MIYDIGAINFINSMVFSNDVMDKILKIIIIVIIIIN